MKVLPSEVFAFFRKQRFVIVSTIDRDNTPHNSCKGIVDIDKKGVIHLLDLYRGVTFSNLERNPNISITAVDEHSFTGYCLKGIAVIVDKKVLSPGIIKAWEKRIAGRITHRLLKNVRGDFVVGRKHHPESLFPMPEYMISVKINGIISLIPSHMDTKEK